MKYNPLKISFLILMISFFSSCKNQVFKKEKSYIVSGKVLTNKLYCGGAQPTKEMIEDLKKPVIYSNKLFFIKEISEDYSNQVFLMKFRSDSLGEFKIDLKAGSYAVFLEEQINITDFSILKNQELNQKCYEEWLKKPFCTIEVLNNAVEGLEFKVEKKCFISKDIPCLNYIGPKPQ